MPHIITQPCIGERDASYYGACRVDAIHPGRDEQLYINPAECIDCGACEPVCPHDAIVEEPLVTVGWQRYIRIDAEFVGA